MKEAAGEANMTVITIILIGVIAAVAIPLITSLMGNTAERTCCTDAGGTWEGGTCQSTAIFDQASYNACVANANGD